MRIGTTPGYTDRYSAFFHGQNVDVTGVRSGVYVLTHRANPSLRLHELRYDNDTASARIRIAWVRGYPTVRVLRSCPATATCWSRPCACHAPSASTNPAPTAIRSACAATPKATASSA